MRTFNENFLWCALLLLSLILLHISRRKTKIVNLNNRIFRDIVVIGLLDVVFELVSNGFIARCADSICIGAVITTHVFFLFQALLPFSLLCYIRVLIENRRLSAREMLLMGAPALSLAFIILTNPFTDALFYFDAMGYQHGPLYYTLYVSAALHLLTALILTISCRRTLGKDRTLALIETFVLAVSGVICQALHPQVLTTGFGMSLSILAMFTTINNPQANTDSLTGLHDKQFLLRRVDEMLAQKKPFHVLTVYLYSLSYVNKAYGMQGGDAMLQHIARQLQATCGTSVFRLTGKRFLILAESLQEYDEDLSGVRALFEDRGTDAPSVSHAILCGVPHAERMGSGDDVMAYIEYLDGLPAPNGSTCVVQANANTLRSFLYNRQVEQFLSRAVEEDLFEVHYQPIYSIRKKRFVTLEALSRLRHPELGWISPDVFIRLAEKNRLIDALTDLQLRRVCRFLKSHEDVARQIDSVKVNLSALNLMQEHCAERLIAILDEYALPHRLFQFEITETVATEYSTRLGRAVDAFSQADIGLCLDDFGSGFANLNTVTHLPFSAIKLDRSLLYHICTDARDALFYQSIVSTFQRMGYNVIAEGVETEKEVALLKKWNVDLIQGYYFSRPLPAPMLLELLKEERG